MSNFKYEEDGLNVSASPEADSSQLAQNETAQDEAESPQATNQREVESSEDVSPEAENSQAAQDEDESSEDDEPPLPVALPVLFENIPEHLRSLKRWALWSYHYGECGGIFRGHYMPDGSSAESTEHWTWSTLRAVQKAYELGGYDGVSLAIGGDGIVLDDSILVGVRLQRQRAQNEDGTWSAWPGEALELVGRLDSYTEVNETGSGLNILVRADLPDALRTSRPTNSTPIPRQFLIDFAYFAPVTGQPVDGVPEATGAIKEVADRTQEMCRLYESALIAPPTPRPRNVLPSFLQLPRERLLEKARAHLKRGKEFRILFDGGEATNVGGDLRAATLKLLDHLAFWTGRNVSLMEELFLDSKLYLDNYESLPTWDEPHFIDGRTFGEGSLDQAIQGCEKVWGGTFALEVTDLPATYGLAADEFGNGERFAAHHGERAKYCPQKEAWTVYNIEEGRWVEGARAGLEAETLAKLTARSLLLEAARTLDPARYQMLFKHAQNNQSVARLGAMLKAARLVEGMTVDATDFDRNPLLLNVQNGTLDLETGRLRPNDPADLLSRLAPVVFDPKAKCPIFEAFVKKVFDGDEGMVECVQRALGISLTGLTTQRFFILQGLGANGKSTLLQAIVPLLGSYAHTIDPELLLVNDGDRRFETAHLVGKRLVVTSENEADARLHEGRIKRWTGGEQLTGEFKFQNSFTFSPQFKLFFNTNDLPAIRGTNHGIWRRPVPIPFRREFWTEDSEVKGPPELKADEHLPAKLKGESSGILNWLLEGSLRWQRHGVYLPQEVLDARDSYRRNQDALGPFLDACCALEAGRRVLSSDLYGAYTWWCQQNNLGEKEVLTRTKFGMNLSARGFVNKRDKVEGKVQWVWKGIGLVS